MKITNNCVKVAARAKRKFTMERCMAAYLAIYKDEKNRFLKIR